MQQQRSGIMVNMASKRLLGVLLVPAIAACASTGSRGAHHESAGATQPVATPATGSSVPPASEPCLQPSSDDVLRLEQFSDTVVQATIATPATQDASTGAWLTPLSKLTVLGQAAKPLPDIRELIDGDDPSSYRQPGNYILFLSNDPGSPYYVITNGLDGTFKITGSSITRECPNYGGTAPTVATAAPAGAAAVTTVAMLKALIPTAWSAYTPPAKPPAGPSGAPAS